MASLSPPAPASEVEELRERVRKLEKINAALIDRVERATDMQGGAYSMFETAIALEAMVRERTAALETALGRLNAMNAQLAAASADADAARMRLRDAIESLSDGFALFDADDKMVMCNSAFLDIWPQFVPLATDSPDFSTMAEALVHARATIGAIVAPDRWLSERVERHRLAAGAHVQWLSNGRWVQINEKRTSEGGTVGVYTDITSVKAEDARQRAQELAERNLALQALLDTLSEGVCMFGPDLRLQAWNGELLNLLEAVDGRKPDPLDLSTHAGLIAWCRSHCHLDQSEALMWRDEGDRRETPCMMGERHFMIRSVRLSTGGMVFTFDDVTESIQFHRSLTETAETLERRVEERTAQLVELNHQLEEAKDEAETANRSKTSFLAAASHDLLQPLNAARLFVSALDECRLPARPRSLVEQTTIALDSVEDLLEALFEISRLDAGAIQPDIRPIALGQIFNALRIEFSPLARAGGLDLIVPETGAWVASDARLLRRVLQNFVSNAIRYTAQGQVAVEITQSEGALTVGVRDTGPGITEKDRELIFREFHRLPHASRIPGKGLGLAIVRRVSTMLGHDITLDTAVGVGSTFSITLPLAQPAAPADGASTPERIQLRRPAHGVVVVIDNDAGVLAGMKALLENWGLDVVATHDPSDPAVGKAFCNEAKDKSPMLCVVDFHLDDGLTGDQAVADLRGRYRADLPAVVVSADRGPETKQALAAMGIPLLYKPVKPAQLRALLRQLEIM
ncbi:response regulator [Novosphingobium umbonatum]|uniref:histidine kinase n=1 Tax=Novosphingobium umbonatum TaxID=1908524 RepID=A0A3S2YC18_9SPHN|nr:ATP-binding protein [Novosphingobium umbonatum]RVU07157.1 response regulator [Novosphingobium umbonatum]